MHGRTDAQLLRLARQGDPRAYEAIVARYREPLRKACARIAPERAEDAVQQALLSAWLAIERGAPVRELRPWLFSIARNAAVDQLRLGRGEVVELGPEVPGGADPAEVEARRRELTVVLGAVAALPERQRRALVDTALHGRPTEDVAGELGLSGGAVRQLVHRARTAVRAAASSIAFPVPAWLAELLGEEGTRRGAVLLGSGSGAALVAKTTATVATVGAVVAGGVSLEERSASLARSAAGANASAAPARRAAGEPTQGAGALLADGGVLVAAVAPGAGGPVGAATALRPVSSGPNDAAGRPEGADAPRERDRVHVDGVERPEPTALPRRRESEHAPAAGPSFAVEPARGGESGERARHERRIARSGDGHQEPAQAEVDPGVADDRAPDASDTPTRPAVAPPDDGREDRHGGDGARPTRGAGGAGEPPASAPAPSASAPASGSDEPSA